MSADGAARRPYLNIRSWSSDIGHDLFVIVRGL